MPLKTKRELATEATTLAQSFAYVRHNHVTYKPVDFETGDDSVTPDPERTIWVPMTRMDIQLKANEQFDTLFYNDAECSAFTYMVAQNARQHNGVSNSLLIRTNEGLRVLKDDGKLHLPTGEFIPNTLAPLLNEDPLVKQEVMNVIANWLDSEEEALSLLRHFATALAPSWSAVRYVLLMGDGRNGKTVLMEMIQTLFGRANCSNVTRQDISERSAVVTDLNGKLLNLVFDGQAVYLKDSGLEKTLIAGETAGVRKLYSSELTPVQTNALFVEGLNKEPKTSDKSTALQARMIRFWFPNTYVDDAAFKARMLSNEYVGALLSLLMDHYVLEQDKAIMLAPTIAAQTLQLEHMYRNSLALQFIKTLIEKDEIDDLIGMEFSELITKFQSWRIRENDLDVWSEPLVLEIFRPVLHTERKSQRKDGNVRKVRFVSALKSETSLFIKMQKGEDVDAAMVVDEGSV